MVLAKYDCMNEDFYQKNIAGGLCKTQILEHQKC